MIISFNETKITGNWILDGAKVVEDENCKRINWLRSNYLMKIATDETGWIILYQDPEDKRYWELVYEHGELQGGGPPSLIQLSKEEATLKYAI
ncbi:MAG: Imm27 family immunity protein [Bacteroidota bacterium]